MTILLGAFLIATVASFIVYKLVGNELSGRTKGKPTTVVVAARDLEIGALIKKEDLTTGQILGEPPKNVILKADAAVGRGVMTPLYKGEPVLETRLAAAGSGGGLAATIPAGMRACAVKVNDVVGVAGFAVPGMRVDVLVSGNPDGAGYNNASAKVKTLLQNIEVLSAGTNFQQDAEGKPVKVEVVNLLVTPEQAEVLSLASNETKIQLVLRNPLDRQIAQPPGSQMASLFGEAAPRSRPAPVVRPVAAVAPPKVEPIRTEIYTVQVFNGGKLSEEKFSQSGVQK
jgi:pilus assembly protein CpaB